MKQRIVCGQKTTAEDVHVNNTRYFPKQDMELLDWACNFVKKAEKYESVIEAKDKELKAIMSKLEAFKTALQKISLGNRTKTLINEKNESRRRFVLATWGFINKNIQNNQEFTVEMRIELGLPVSVEMPNKQGSIIDNVIDVFVKLLDLI